MGPGACLLFPQGAIYNEHLVHIGAETMIWAGVSISAGMAPGQVMPTDPVVSIGSRTWIGRGWHIGGPGDCDGRRHPARSLHVHHRPKRSYDDPVEPVGASGRPRPRCASDRAVAGANAVILPGARIGEHVVVAAGAVVRARFRTVVWSPRPARVVKRWVEGAGWVPRRRSPTVRGRPRRSW